MIDLDELMGRAVAEGEKARYHAPPNPWVGALVVDGHGAVLGVGHTQVPVTPTPKWSHCATPGQQPLASPWW